MRVIPIRSRGEFLPSAMAFSTLDRRIGGQLSLPLNDQAAVDQEPLIEKTVPHEAQRAVARAPVATERLATEPRVEKPAVAASAANPNQARDAGRTQKNPTVIPFPRPARRSAASPVPKDWPGRSARRPTAPFTLRGFMTGFAVGSAAAALLLVFLNAAM
jgi:hypothetical protein